jgi:Fe-S oxidoreductase
VTQTPGLSHLVKAIGGIPQRRRLPPFASQTFQEWFARRGPSRPGRLRVIVWPDTFNNYFYPRTAKAAVEVLEALGCQVVVPTSSLCCGRPLYDFGMLSQAKHQLRRILTALKSEIDAGTPIVGLEPSCVAVFRDELTNLFPHDVNAMRLSRQTFTLAEFLQTKLPHALLPALPFKAIVHGHCHQKAVMKLDAEQTVLERLGLDFTILDSGCCGMAGSFGFKREHYQTSLKIGNLALLPAVREAAKETMVLADGFSCREQLRQTTNRRALHLAEVLHLAMQKAVERGRGVGNRNGYGAGCPERSYFRHTRAASGATIGRGVLAAFISVATFLIGAKLLGRRHR